MHSTPRPAKRVRRREPRGQTITDWLCLIAGVAIGAPLMRVLVTTASHFPEVWPEAVRALVGAATILAALGVSLALWCRDLQYRRSFRLAEWLVVVQAGAALRWATFVGLRSWFEWQNQGSPTQFTILIGEIAMLLYVLFLLAISARCGRRLSPRTRRKLRVPFYLLCALALWSLNAIAYHSVSAMVGYTAYYVSPPWHEIPTVAREKLPEIAIWLGPGLIYGVPLALVWQQRNQPAHRPMRWTEWSGIAIGVLAMCGVVTNWIITIAWYEHVWWTELIWQVPAAILVVCGSWLGAALWRRRRTGRANLLRR